MHHRVEAAMRTAVGENDVCRAEVVPKHRRKHGRQEAVEGRGEVGANAVNVVVGDAVVGPPAGAVESHLEVIVFVNVEQEQLL